MATLEVSERQARLTRWVDTGDLLEALAPGQNPTIFLKINCPVHEDDTASVAVYRDHAHCFGCNAHWGRRRREAALGVADLLAALPNEPIAVGVPTGPRSRPVPVTQSQVRTLHDWLMRQDGPWHAQLPAMLARGLRQDTLEANLIGHTGEAFSIPMYEGKELATIRYRRDDTLETYGRPKYWGTRGRNEAMLYAPYMPPGASPLSAYPGLVFLCEGELDALRLAQEGLSAVSLTNGVSALTKDNTHLLDLVRGHTIMVAYDQDDPGRAGAERVRSLLEMTGWNVSVSTWHPIYGKDVTDFLLRHPLALWLDLVLPQCP